MPGSWPGKVEGRGGCQVVLPGGDGTCADPKRWIGRREDKQKSTF